MSDDILEHLRPWATDPNEGIQNYITRETDRVAKEMALAVETGARDELIRILTSQGYLVIPPGDASSVGELVRAACMPSGPTVFTHQEYDGRLHNVGMAVAQDPAVRAWSERGRK